MITKVLVALDDIGANPPVFEYALDLAIKYQAQLHIFHCVEPPLTAVPEMSVMAIYGGMLDSATINLRQDIFQENLSKISTWLKILKEKAEARNLQVESSYVMGEPQAEICAIANTWEADLLVIGRRGLQGIGEILLGSVSNYVLHHAPCSVLIVQNQS